MSDEKYIYINLHPDYDYASVIMGVFTDIRDYVKLVDWLCWGVNQREVLINGDRQDGEQHKGSHITLKRIDAFVQRMEQMERGVRVRNWRDNNEPWREWEYKKLSEEELLQIEYGRVWEADSIRWAKKDCEKYRIFENEEGEARQLWEYAQEKMRKALEDEEKRKKSIKAMWEQVHKKREERKAQEEMWHKEFLMNKGLWIEND